MMPFMKVNDNQLPMFKEFAFDFESGSQIFDDGKPIIVEGIEALKVWTFKALNISRYRYDAVSWQYGVEIENYIGTDELTVEKLYRLLNDALLICPYIKSVNVVGLIQQGNRYDADLSINTVYGEVRMNVEYSG